MIKSGVLLCLLIGGVFGNVTDDFGDFCSLNTFPGVSGNQMQFSKEPSAAEFGIKGKFKGLHCCAKGYRSIEW